MVHRDSNGYSEQRVEKDKRYTSPVDRGKQHKHVDSALSLASFPLKHCEPQLSNAKLFVTERFYAIVRQPLPK